MGNANTTGFLMATGRFRAVVARVPEVLEYNPSIAIRVPLTVIATAPVGEDVAWTPLDAPKAINADVFVVGRDGNEIQDNLAMLHTAIGLNLGDEHSDPTRTVGTECQIVVRANQFDGRTGYRVKQMYAANAVVRSIGPVALGDIQRRTWNWHPPTNSDADGKPESSPAS